MAKQPKGLSDEARAALMDKVDKSDWPEGADITDEAKTPNGVKDLRQGESRPSTKTWGL